MNEQLIVLLQIQPSSGIPIYKQIIEQVKRFILSGQLKAGEGLPSVRQVAGYLAVNPMTISKAYSLLEAMGLLERVRGKGMIVAANQAANPDMTSRVELLYPILVEVVTQARQLDIPEKFVLEELGKLMEDLK